MPDKRSRVEKLRAMANQTESPNEAAIARGLLEQMGESVEPEVDPLQKIRYADKRARNEPEEVFRQRRNPFGQQRDFYEEMLRDHRRTYFYGNASPPPREKTDAEGYKTEPPPNRNTYPREKMYLRQKEAYDKLLEFYRAFRQNMSSREYQEFEALLQTMDPNGVYFTEKILEWEAEQGRQKYYDFKDRFGQAYDFKAAYNWYNENVNSQEEVQRKAEEALKAQAMRDEELRKQEAADKAAQKIKDERERRERDEAMGSFEAWFRDFKQGKS